MLPFGRLADIYPSRQWRSAQSSPASTLFSSHFQNANIKLNDLKLYFKKTRSEPLGYESWHNIWADVTAEMVWIWKEELPRFDRRKTGWIQRVDKKFKIENFKIKYKYVHGSLSSTWNYLWIFVSAHLYL